MKRWLTALLILMVCLAGFVFAGAEGLQKDVLVLFTSDVHCGVDQGFTYAGLKSIRDAAEDSGKNHVLLVDDGDSIQGEPIGILTRGEISIKLMNAMGYDIAIPGNHEFDYTVERFMELVEMANFPYICCNFHKNGELVFDPYIIKEFDGVKIAFVGVTTPETLISSTPRYFQDEEGNYIYDFSQGGNASRFYETIQQSVDNARAEGASYVILMGHLGNEASVAPYLYSDVIEHTTGIDAVLDGHSHDSERVVMKNKEGKDVIRQACGTKMAAVGWMRISAADGSVDTGLYTWNNSLTAPELLGIWNSMSVTLAEAIDPISKRMATPLAESRVALTINDPSAKDASGAPIRLIRRAETNLGDFCADAFRAVSGADIGLANGGSIRVSINEGTVTVGDILNVYPFGNQVMMAEATGQQVLDALEWGARAVPEENGAFLHVSGLTYEIHTYIESSCSRDPESGLFTGVTGEYRVKNVMVGDEPLDLNKTYTVASLSYTIADQGDGCTAFDGCKILWTSLDLDYETLIAYIQDKLGGVISDDYAQPYGQERIIAVPQPAE